MANTVSEAFNIMSCSMYNVILYDDICNKGKMID